MAKENNELDLIANEYQDNKGNEFTQVIASCKCGRGGWIRLPKHVDVEALIQQKQLEARLDELEDWVNVDTIPGIKIDPQTVLESMFDAMRDRIAQLSTPPKKEETL